MRVIAGSARRLNLKTISGENTRPTTDRIKETLFNIINNELNGREFLDLFSGSGAIGIEALSRGAKECVFVENNPKATDCILENLNFTKLSDQGIVIKKDVLSAIKELDSKSKIFDFVYMDPPYNKGLEREVLKELLNTKIIDNETMIIIEADKNDDFEDITLMGYRIVREKIYKTNKHIFAYLNQEGLW